MKKAGIITIGNEIISGDIVDTNSRFLSESLKDIGYKTDIIISVGDDFKNINNAFLYTLEYCDFIIITGGLGPTIDDITIECIAKSLNRNLIFDETILKDIEDKFSKRNRIMTKNNFKQAYRIENSNIIENKKGTAVGSYLNVNETEIIILPGPPDELEYLFNKIKYNFITNNHINTIIIKFVGIGESKLESEIIDLISDDVVFGIFADKQFVDIKLTAYGCNQNENLNILNGYRTKIIKKLGKYVYSTKDSIMQVIVDILRNRGETLAICESCTGGMLTSMFVDIAGVSDVLNEGLVTYTNLSKHLRLGIDEETILKYDAVSVEVAKEMALNIVKTTGANLGVSITGMASYVPNSKPVGLVYIGIYYRGKTSVKELHLDGDRSIIRKRSCQCALESIYRILKE
ncbi:MAG: competence/damage-inducible protein A [Bacilli bacterium]